MIDQLDYGFLRNPFLILVAFSVIIMPGFLANCGFEIPGLFSSIAADAPSCTTSFVSNLFIGQSILSLFMVIITFEMLRYLKRPFKLEILPSRLTQLIGYEIRIFIGLAIGGGAYALIITLISFIDDGMSDSMGLGVFSLSVHEYLKVLLVGFVLINMQLIYKIRLIKKAEFNNYIEGTSAFGSIVLDIRTVNWFEKRGRYYYAFSDEGKSKVPYNLQTLEERLDSNNFIRVNRSAIVNRGVIDGYSYWENEKYILRTVKDKEFVISRKRMNVIKDWFGNQPQDMPRKE